VYIGIRNYYKQPYAQTAHQSTLQVVSVAILPPMIIMCGWFEAYRMQRLCYIHIVTEVTMGHTMKDKFNDHEKV